MRARQDFVAMALAVAALPALAFDAPVHFIGDLGWGVGRTWASARARTRAPPYAYGDFGRLFIREDTFGVKLAPLGAGSLEAVGRVSTEGTDGDGPGLAHRANPRPLGLGTYQETRWGGVFADAFVDTVSGGTLVEASYAVDVTAGPVTFYPQAGLTRRGARYEAHLRDVHAASTTPVLQLSAELPFAPHWALLAHAQWEPFSRAERQSGRVQAPARATALVVLVRRFE